MSELHTLQIALRAIPPDTVEGIHPKLEQEVRSAVRNTPSLDEKDIKVVVKDRFPVGDAILVLLEFVSAAALLAFKELVIPALKQKFQVEETKEDASSS